MSDRLKFRARSFKCRFFEAGVSRNDDGSVILIKNDNLERLAAKFKGIPIIIEHQDLTLDNIDQEKVGVITNIYFQDGWAWCEMLIDNSRAAELLDSGFGVSNCYIVLAKGPNGAYHNIEYDYEVLDWQPDHLAIVNNPRYEGVKVIKNSIDKSMKLFTKIFNKIKNAFEEKDIEKLFVKNEKGEKVKLCDIVENYKKMKNEAAEKAKQEEKAKKNHEEEEYVVNGDDEVDIDGEKVKVSDLMKTYKAETAEEKEIENEKDEKESDKKDEEDAETVKNAKAKEEEEMADFEKVKNAKEKFEESEKEKVKNEKAFVEASTEYKQLEMGSKIYGSTQVVEKK